MRVHFSGGRDDGWTTESDHSAPWAFGRQYLESDGCHSSLYRLARVDGEDLFYEYEREQDWSYASGAERAES